MLAFVFPGQGSQKPGMGRGLFESYAAARDVFERADDALGWSLSQLCFDGPEDQLRLTANSQPAILATSIAAYEALRAETSLRPDVVAGHSLGEYSALVAAEALSLEDAVRLVHKRGQFMQEAVPAGEGTMAAILGLPREAVEAICQEAAEDQVLATANLNGPGQVVIAGHARAIERALPLAKARGGRAVPLKVSAPFHCQLMAPAAVRLREQIESVKLRDPRVPVISNVDAEPNRSGKRAAQLLVEQVTAPVRWEDCVARMLSMGVQRIIEAGPGQVLSGLIKRMVSTVDLFAVEDRAQIERLELLQSATHVFCCSNLAVEPSA